MRRSTIQLHIAVTRFLPTHIFLSKFAVLQLYLSGTTMHSRYLYIAILGLLAHCSALAQLDTIHWLPPMHARSELGPQYLYISTPETTPFPVTLQSPEGNVYATLMVSNAQPQEYYIGSSGDTPVLVLSNDLHHAVSGKGYIVTGPKSFYVNFRYHSDDRFQAADITCKGHAALGTEFRIGHVIQSNYSDSGRSNFVGVLATEDSTLVTLSDFDNSSQFEVAGVLKTVNGPQQVMLMNGQSVVFSHYLAAGNSNGLVGALLSATKPVAVNVGSWTGSPVDNSNDVGLDQITPFDKVGEEYILCKGNGSSDLETPLVVAHVDGTKVFLNGESTPTAILNAGKYLRIPTNRYSPAGNLYINCSQPAFVYQIVGGIPSGDDAKRTAGLIFVPPISCSIPNAVDNIYKPNQIGDITYDGGLMIVAMRDSLVETRLNGNLINLGAPDAVPGNPDFVTYRRLDLYDSNNPIKTASVIAHGAVQVAMFGRNGAAGYGSFYSGFSKTDKATVALSLVGDGVCPDTLVASGHFDGIQWYFADSLLTYGPDSMFTAYSPGKYTARAYLGVCRKADYEEDTLSAFFNSPVFPYSLREPSCYGFSNGQVHFDTPSGGLAPYEYSVDQGHSFSKNPDFTTLKSGTYQLVARDSTGCYNRPLEVSIGQPDSLSVRIDIVKIEEPVKVGDQVTLQGVPNREIDNAAWAPLSAGVANFLNFIAKPTETTDYILTVRDSSGCEATDKVRIVIQPNVFAPNAFYPESNRLNESFTLFSKDNLPINYLRIYDRWGNLVFENKGMLTNDRSAGWNGTYHGDLLDPAVFVFIAEIEYEPGRKIILKGDVTLIR